MTGGTVVVNGRFLRAPRTGVQRVGRALIDAVRACGVDLEVVAPRVTDDERVDRQLTAPRGRLGEHVWEQIVLPAYARARPILSLANSSPLAARCGVVMLHDLSPQVAPEWFSRTGRANGALAVRAARRARAVLVPSNAVRDELTRAGFAARRVHVVRPAVDLSFVRAPADDVERVRREVGITAPYLVQVGWADPRKDVDRTLRLHQRLLDGGVDHQLVLVGRPVSFFASVRAPSGVPTVRVVPQLPDGDLRALLTGAAALVFPSRYEGFGIPPLEAAACGTPAVVSDLPVLRESAAGAAHFAALDDDGAWLTLLRAALVGELTPGSPPPWTWHDAAAQLREALAVVGAVERVG